MSLVVDCCFVVIRFEFVYVFVSVCDCGGVVIEV